MRIAKIKNREVSNITVKRFCPKSDLGLAVDFLILTTVALVMTALRNGVSLSLENSPNCRALSISVTVLYHDTFNKPTKDGPHIFEQH